MSKSLKNFITIQDALKKNSCRELRIFFLLHSWNSTLDYSTSAMEEASSYSKTLRDFLLNVQVVLNDGSPDDSSRDEDLNGQFEELKSAVEAALCDNVDTKTALMKIKAFIGFCNKHLDAKKEKADRALLKEITAYIERLFEIFGVESSNDANQSVDVMPYLRALADFREAVRQEARTLKASKILELCDKLRDDVLPNLGVSLEDRENAKPAIKLVPRDELLREREAKRQAEEAKRLEKERKKAELAAKEAEKEAKRRVPPTEMFKGNS